jgi:predicted DNA-binding WGR domain protein
MFHPPLRSCDVHEKERSMSRREFEFVEGSSSKFWAIELSGSQYTVNWGRIGTAGQTQSKSFASDAEARKQYDKLIEEKTSKGYKEVGGGTAVATAPAAPALKAAKTAAPKPITPPAAVPAVPANATKSAPAGPPPAAPAPAAEPPPSPALPVSLEVKREIRLDPADWLYATWRKRTPLPRPTPRPFDKDACAAAVARIRPGTYGWDWKWEKLGTPSVLSPQEAVFWLEAMSLAGRERKPADVAEELRKKDFPSEVSKEEALKYLEKAGRFGGVELLKMAASLLPPLELADLLIEISERDRNARGTLGWQFGNESIVGFRRHVLPYMTDDELGRLRARVEPLIDPKNWPSDHYAEPSAAFFLGAACGLHGALLAVVRGIPANAYTQDGWDHAYYHQVQLLIMGLGSADLVNTEMRRLKLRLNRPEFVRGWLATTEFAGLDYLRDSILRETNAEQAAEQLEPMALVEAPEAAPHMLELKMSSRAPRVAREWLERYPACAISGLVPVAGGRGKLADAAIDTLMDMKRKGYGEPIARAGAAVERVRKEVIEHEEAALPELTDAEAPPWLAGAKPGKAKLPGWTAPETMPPLTLKGKRLSPAQTLAVLSSLQASPAGKPDDLLKGLKAEGDPDANDAFAWRLFDLWLSDGAPSREKWAMVAIGHLGGDASALRITPMIRAWPGESQHQRAVTGLECLRAIGSDTALMCLNGIAQKLKFKGLKTKAQELMEAIASDRNMSRTELEDRIVPDCDLDAKGTRIFDFGPRQFRFVLGPEMKAMIKDADGKVRGDLPAPSSKDDAEKAAAAVEEWKLLKKQIKEVAKIQAERLEQAMVTGRRWKTSEFKQLLMKHPLMVNFVRLLVWGGYDARNKLAGTFRVTEDGTCANEQDDGVEIDGYTWVGIVHPLHLPADTARAWGQVFGDYEIVPPFQQLGRPVYTLEPGEEKETELKRWKGTKIPATALVGTLERLAWIRGIPQDGGVFYEHTKPFPGAAITAVVEYEQGVPVGYMEGWDDQEITRAYFVRGVYKPAMYPKHEDTLKLGEVDPVAISEVLKDLILIASKGK